MQFRKDINGLRAIAVIAIVLFHFNADWMPGGFAGVDVFFVISGFLMTRIIFCGIEQDNFSIVKFYVARANRIIPALAVLCLVLLVLGWFYLNPLDYEILGKHVGSSIGFFSNIVYWSESGYFDATSHEKWLLHTWSLSAEWQFYIIYPLVLVAMSKVMSLKAMKASLIVGAVIGFIFCVIATYKWPNASYYLLPSRAWEMMIGGIAYLYPFKLTEHNKKYFEWSGLALITLSYLFVSKDNPWPGYLAVIPVLGAFLLIQAQRTNSILTSNIIFQSLGKWSYSIYLWHWPIVVAIYYFSFNAHFVYVGLALSIMLGYLSSKYIECVNFRNDFLSPTEYLQCKPIILLVIVGSFGSCVFINDGFINLAQYKYKNLMNGAVSSPYRSKCHIRDYKAPAQSCEYFGKHITWATLGDSHTVEIAYALAKKLKANDEGLKHFSFSGCLPSYKQENSFSKCTQWYNESINYIVANEDIQHVVFNHRFTATMFGEDIYVDPNDTDMITAENTLAITKNIDDIIFLLASKKEQVYVFYPIPELPKNIHQLLETKLRQGGSLENIIGTDVNWYQTRNSYMLNHFNQSHYPDNVTLLDPKDVFCDESNCYAVKDGVPLYFDDDHPSVLGASKLVELITAIK